MTTDNKLDKNGLSKVWQKVFSLIKTITGDVDIENKGTLQHQIDNMGTGKGAKEISWAEYSALSDEEKNNGTLYAIPDAPFVSDLTIQAMTLEMYEALTEEEKMDDTVRFISDATFFADGEEILALDVVDDKVNLTQTTGAGKNVIELAKKTDIVCSDFISIILDYHKYLNDADYVLYKARGDRTNNTFYFDDYSEVVIFTGFTATQYQAVGYMSRFVFTEDNISQVFDAVAESMETSSTSILIYNNWSSGGTGHTKEDFSIQRNSITIDNYNSKVFLKSKQTN